MKTDAKIDAFNGTNGSSCAKDLYAKLSKSPVNNELLEVERKLKRAHVVIRKIQALVPGSHELDKFDAYSNCLTWLHQLRSMYEMDRQLLLEHEEVADLAIPDSLSDEDVVADEVGAVEDISQ